MLVVFRKLKKNHGFAFINLLGLSVGLGVCFLIYLYIQDPVLTQRLLTMDQGPEEPVAGGAPIVVPLTPPEQRRIEGLSPMTSTPA